LQTAQAIICFVLAIVLYYIQWVYTGWLILQSALPSRSRNTSMGVTATIILHDIEPSIRGETNLFIFFPRFRERVVVSRPPRPCTVGWVVYISIYTYRVFIITVTFGVNRLSNVLGDRSTLPPPALKMDAVPTRGIVQIMYYMYRCSRSAGRVYL